MVDRVTNPRICIVGSTRRGVHQWVYQGKQAQTYICQVCGNGISKADLKRDTDSGAVELAV